MATSPIVVGVDGSEESLRAVEWAALEARRHQAPLRIVSAPAMPAPAMPALGAAVTRAEEIAPDLIIDAGLLSAAPPAQAVADSGSGAILDVSIVPGPSSLLKAFGWCQAGPKVPPDPMTEVPC